MGLRRVGSWLVLSAVIATVGCGGSGAAETPAGEQSSGGEGATTGYEGAITSTDAAAGKETFDTFCGDCHPDGQEDTGPSLIADPHTAAQIRKQVREGSGKMRPFSSARLSDADLENVLAWLASVNAAK
jgi:mono/diheme cytochrome c family protein